MWVKVQCPTCSASFEVSGRGWCRMCKTYLVHHFWRRKLTIEPGTRAYLWQAETDGPAVSFVNDFEGVPVEQRGRWQRIGAGEHTKPDKRVRHWHINEESRKEPRWRTS